MALALSWDENWPDVLSAIAAVIAIGLAIFSIWQSSTANKRSKEANLIAARALALEEAREQIKLRVTTAVSSDASGICELEVWVRNEGPEVVLQHVFFTPPSDGDVLLIQGLSGVEMPRDKTRSGSIALRSAILHIQSHGALSHLQVRTADGTLFESRDTNIIRFLQAATERANAAHLETS